MKQKTIELQDGIRACVTYVAYHNPPFWAFAYEFWDYDDDTGELLHPVNDGSEYVQVTMLGGQDPDELLFKGIKRYELPMPRLTEDRDRYAMWLETQS